MLWSIRQDYWSHLLIGAMVTIAAATRWRSDTHLGLHGLLMAVIAGWARLLHFATDARREIIDGRQASRWTWASVQQAQDEPDASSCRGAEIRRMRTIDEYLSTIAQQHRLQQLTVAVVDRWDQRGHPKEAASIRQGRRAHIWLGSSWLAPEDADHLPVLIEHELGHVLRHDNQSILAVQATGILFVVLAAAWLPFSVAVLVAAVLWLLHTAWCWWKELACDARAVRVCGPDAVIALWAHAIALQVSSPRPVRLWKGLRSARSHPPSRVRIWWARHAVAQ
jgi:Zn-dependent protease with chaperone function